MATFGSRLGKPMVTCSNSPFFAAAKKALAETPRLESHVGPIIYLWGMIFFENY
jgi:hypothetical protein